MSEILYRYETDYPDEDSTYETAGVRLRYFHVVKRTPKGAWIKISEYSNKKRFVLNDSKKRYAHETKGQALDAFIARKRRHISILNWEMDMAKQSLEVAKRMAGYECN